MLTSFQKFLSKIEILKKSQNLDFSKIGGRIQNFKKINASTEETFLVAYLLQGYFQVTGKRSFFYPFLKIIINLNIPPHTEIFV